MNCIIIDDEATARAIVQELCTQFDEIEVVAMFSNAIEAIKFLNQNEVDLIFLDIHMPDYTGFDFIETVKNPPHIILTTSDPNFAIQAFEYDCIVDYLIKPVTPERFQKSVQKARSIASKTSKLSTSDKDVTSSGNDLYVNIGKRLIKINIPSIYLVEAKGDYIKVKIEDKTFTIHSTLKKIEDKLPQDLFLKVHRSFIINVKKIIDIADNSVLIQNDVVPVSRSNRPELMKRLNLL
ncbi:LytR/AlgR family response regulator transcription factor [Yeosuana sp. AK3]